MANQLTLPDHFKKTKGGSSSTAALKKADIKNHVAVEDKKTDDPSSSDEDLEIKLLRDFDLTCKYGPCLGMTRLERWNRAKKLGLDPPDCVYSILQRHCNESMYTECLWRDEKGLLPPPQVA